VDFEGRVEKQRPQKSKKTEFFVSGRLGEDLGPGAEVDLNHPSGVRFQREARREQIQPTATC
jgi:hypothetical protein